MRICYVKTRRLNQQSNELLARVNKIIDEYRHNGYRLTLRQLYYQLVSRGIIKNAKAEYNKLSRLLTIGRLAGLVDWDAIEDRLRRPTRPTTFESPQQLIKAGYEQYRRDRMAAQYVHIEVWVEKDALSGVLKKVIDPFGCYLQVNRGYTSTSALHDTFLRFQEAWGQGQQVVILYLGDHDPSGKDMVRDVRDRIWEYYQGSELPKEDYDKLLVIKPIALTQEQIAAYALPPNPVKTTDTRAQAYQSEHGVTCWEVDALPPDVLHQLVKSEIEGLIDRDIYAAMLALERKDKEELAVIMNSL